MAVTALDPSVGDDGDTNVADGREIEMDRYTRRQHFESLCSLRESYSRRGADDTTTCISVEEVIAYAIDLLERPDDVTIDADGAHPKTV